MEARRSRRKLMSDINVVPFVDILLVLVVIFMVTSPVVTQGVDVDLPQADAEPVKSEDDTLVVSVNAEGNYFITTGEVSTENPEIVSLEKIIEDVSKIVAANPELPVFLEGDSAVDYGKVMLLFAALADAGVDNIRLITLPPG